MATCNPRWRLSSVVDLDAQSLEGSCGGMDPPRPVAARDRLLDDAAQLGGGGEGLEPPGTDQGVGDGGGETLLAVAADQGRQVGGLPGVDDVRGGQCPLGRIHAHVQGPVEPEAETAGGIAELMGGETEVEGDGVGVGDPVFRGDGVQIGEVAVGEDEAVAAAGETPAGRRDRIGIAVDGEHPPGRADAFQERGGDTAAAQGAVDGDLAFTGLQGFYERM